MVLFLKWLPNYRSTGRICSYLIFYDLFFFINYYGQKIKAVRGRVIVEFFHNNEFSFETLFTFI